MADVPYRSRREDEVRRAVKRVFRKYRDAKHNRQPPYARMKRELVKELVPILDRLRRQTVRQFLREHAPDVKASQVVIPSSRQHVLDMVDQMVETSRDEWRAMGRRKKREDVLKWREKHLGNNRAQRIAITEVTYNHQVAQDAAWSYLRRTQGSRLQAFWNAEPGRCELCATVEGKPSAFWRMFYPAGPPAHPNCRCHLRYTNLTAVAPRGLV